MCSFKTEGFCKYIILPVLFFKNKMLLPVLFMKCVRVCQSYNKVGFFFLHFL